MLPIDLLTLEFTDQVVKAMEKKKVRTPWRVTFPGYSMHSDSARLVCPPTRVMVLSGLSSGLALLCRCQSMWNPPLTVCVGGFGLSAPDGPPQEVHLEPISSQSIRVTWKVNHTDTCFPGTVSMEANTSLMLPVTMLRY